MTKPKSLTISAPFEARHVSGVSVPGAAIPITGIERSSSSTLIKPDEPPSHTFVAHGNIEVPRRSNTIVSTLSRPSLKLKTSISRLRRRSNSNSQEVYRKGAGYEQSESLDAVSHGDMSVHSLRKVPSTSRFWHKTHRESPVAESLQEEQEALKVSAPVPPAKSSPALQAKPLLSRVPSMPTINLYTRSTPQPPLPPPPVPETRPPVTSRVVSQKQPPTTRPKRADSGTAINFNDVPATERPLGFKEILAVPSFAERMALYKRTREYWANADHGLHEWVEKAGTRLTFPV